MMKNVLWKTFLPVFCMLCLYSCGKQTDLVESGTYRGTVDKVVVEKSEIYVKTANGKLLELYFNEDTELTQNGQNVPFETLKKGQEVDVTVEKVDQSLKPVVVSIIEQNGSGS